MTNSIKQNRIMAWPREMGRAIVEGRNTFPRPW